MMRRACWQTLRNNCRTYASKKRIARREARDEEVLEFRSEASQRAVRLYGCGFVSTGALGVERLVKPKYGEPIDIMRRPIRLAFFPTKQLQVRSAACGYGFSVFICKSKTEKWQLFGCGLNSDSQIGLQQRGFKGEIDGERYVELLHYPRPIPLSLSLSGENTPVDVACGRAHTIFQTMDGSIYSLGNNAFGQCGREIIDGEIFRNSSVVSKIRIQFDEGTDKVKKVVCGQDHTLVLTEKGHVYSCGLGSDGQLGLGHFENVWTLTRVRGDIDDRVITHIASRGDTVLACCSDGHIYGWGNSEYAQLSDTDIQLSKPHRLFCDVDFGHVTQVAAAGSSCAILNAAGEVYVWGYGKLGHGPQVTTLPKPIRLPPPLFGANELDSSAVVSSIASGLHHFVALNNRGTLFSWGSNRSGCLGLGQKEDQTFPMRVSIPAETVSVECGVDHMIIKSKAFA